MESKSVLNACYHTMRIEDRMTCSYRATQIIITFSRQLNIKCGIHSNFNSDMTDGWGSCACDCACDGRHDHMNGLNHCG